MKKVLSVLLAMVLCLSIPVSSLAHSGRTDSRGGHNDNINGGYHYHCGGYPAHSHPNGVCPYKSGGSSSSSSSGTKSSSSSSSIKRVPVYVNGVYVNCPTPARMISNSVWVPLRPVLEALNTTVDASQYSNKKMINNSTFVPAKDIASKLNIVVDYNGSRINFKTY